MKQEYDASYYGKRIEEIIDEARRHGIKVECLPDEKKKDRYILHIENTAHKFSIFPNDNPKDPYYQYGVRI